MAEPITTGQKADDLSTLDKAIDFMWMANQRLAFIQTQLTHDKSLNEIIGGINSVYPRALAALGRLRQGDAYPKSEPNLEASNVHR